MDTLGLDWDPTEHVRPAAEPVALVVREAAAAWAKREDRLEAEAPKPDPAAAPEPAAERPVPSVRGGYGNTPVTYQILEEAMRKLVKDERAGRNKAIEAWAKVIADEMAKVFASGRTKTTWRFEEAERRIAELEARLAKLEGRSHDGR